VPDHPEPLAELRRLLVVRRAYDRMNAGDVLLGEDDMEGALHEYEAAQAAVPDNVEFAFWCGVTLASVGKVDEARSFMARAFEGEGDWRELLRRLPDVGVLPQDAAEALLGD
jgi:hypothetical protein